jgi:Ca2+-binding EF-hand superfamily protein
LQIDLTFGGEELLSRTPIYSLGLSACLIAAAWTANAQEPTVKPTVELPRNVATITSRYREGYISSLMSQFRRAAGPDQILEKSDIDQAQKRQAASNRANRIRNTLQHDLDADGTVTRDEVVQALQTGNANAAGIARQVDRIMAPDLDKDGKITIEEALRFEPATRNSTRTQDRITDLLSLDPNGDGRLTGNELESVGRVIFSRYDRDGNGHISDDENKVWQADRNAANKRAREMPTASQIAQCKLPPLPTGAKIHLVSSYSSYALSNVTIAGQDLTTVTTEIYVEPGDQPMYVVAASKTPRIWRFRGSTERVVNFVALSYGKSQDGSKAGVVGLARDRVSFTAPETCFRYFTNADRPEARKAKALVSQILDQPVASVVAKYNLTELALPSGITPPDPAGSRKGTTFIIGGKEFIIRNGRPVPADETMKSANAIPPFGVDPETYRQFRRYFPGGVVKINPDRVNSPQKAERYNVLPTHAGLIELLKDGSLEKISSRKYRIVRPIERYPAGLQGASSVTFVLAKGIPQPTGTLGHSCLLSEETGKQIAGSKRCR